MACFDTGFKQLHLLAHHSYVRIADEQLSNVSMRPFPYTHDFVDLLA